jgi:hypothetical protein
MVRMPDGKLQLGTPHGSNAVRAVARVSVRALACEGFGLHSRILRTRLGSSPSAPLQFLVTSAPVWFQLVWFREQADCSLRAGAAAVSRIAEWALAQRRDRGRDACRRRCIRTDVPGLLKGDLRRDGGGNSGKSGLLGRIGIDKGGRIW